MSVARTSAKIEHIVNWFFRNVVHFLTICVKKEFNDIVALFQVHYELPLHVKLWE